MLEEKPKSPTKQTSPERETIHRMKIKKRVEN